MTHKNFHAFIIVTVLTTVLLYARSEIPYEITQYEIHVKIPETYGRFEVQALLDIQDLVPDSRDDLNIILGKDFKGIEPVNIQIFDKDRNPADFEIHEDTFGLVATIQWNERLLPRIVIQYDLIEDEEYEKDKYVTFACEMSDTLNHINAAITRTDNWYPKIEGTMTKRLPKFKLFIDVPSKFEVMASGKLMRTISENARTIYAWQNYEEITDRSLYFFASERKKIIKGYPDGFKVIMYVPEIALEDNLTYLADVIYKSYKFFEEIYGEVPGDEYKIMAFTYGYSGLFNSMTAPMSLFVSEIHNNEIYHPIRNVIHELSHTWWGNVVSSNAEENYWLYEGFAKFSEAIGIKPALDVDIEKLSFFRLKMASIPYCDKVPSILDAGKEEDRQLQSVAAYYMGATYLKMLEHALGKKNFYKAIKDYVGTHRGKCVATEDFIALMKKYSSNDIYNVLSDYLIKPGYAHYTISKTGSVERCTHYRHTFELRNAGDKDICTEFSVETDWEKYRKKLILKKGETRFIKVESSNKDDSELIFVDPDSTSPVLEDGLRGSGGIVYKNPQGEVKCINVVEDSPLANAGIRDNMTLLKVNDEELTAKDLHELNYMLLQPEGSQLILLVQAGEEPPYEVTVSY